MSLGALGRDDAVYGVATVPAAAPERPLKRLYLSFALLLAVSAAALGIRGWLKPADGLNVEYFHTLNREGRPAFGLVVPEISALRVDMDWTDRAGGPPEVFSARWFGYLAIGRAGDYTFATTSDDGSVLFADGTLVVDNRGTHGAVTKTGRIRLEPGPHALLIEFDQEGGFREMQWSWARGDGPLAPVAPWRLSPERTPYWCALTARAADVLWAGAFAGALLVGIVLLYTSLPRHIAFVPRDPRPALAMIAHAHSVPRRAGDIRGAAATALLSYAVSGLATLILLQRLAQAPPGVRLPLIVLACAAVLPLAVTAAVVMRWPSSRPLEVAYGFLLIFMVAMIWLGAVSPRLYGDNVVRFGQAASPSSVFFKADYALSELHLRDVAYLVTWGGGWLMPAVFVMGAVVASRRIVDERLATPLARDARTWLGVTLGVWQLYYLIFMIPKFGPTNDVDLFWPSTVVFAFFGGRLLDLVNRPRLKLAIFCAVAGCGVATSVYLAWIGLPRRS